MLPKLATKATSSVLDKLGRNISGQGAVRAGKGFISNEDKDDIIRIVKSLEKSGLIIDIAIETLKHEIKIQEGGFACALAPTASSLMQPVASSLINVKLEKTKKGKWWVFTVISITFNDEYPGKRSYSKRL